MVNERERERGGQDMTTAHRPTWAPAKGHEEQGGGRAFAPSKHYSSRDMPAHTKLKYRADYLENEEEEEGARDAFDIGRDLRAELLKRERAAARKRLGAMSGKDVDDMDGELAMIERNAALVEERLKPSEADADYEEEEEDEEDERENGDGGGRSGGMGGGFARQNYRDEGGEGAAAAADDDDADSDDDSDDEDDTAALLAELEKIKKERAAAAAEAAVAAAADDERKFEAEAATGNPLLDIGGTTDDGTMSSAAFGLKRRWDEDVVFRNQARDEPKQQRRFINDTIRSDFHRRFLNKYIK